MIVDKVGYAVKRYLPASLLSLAKALVSRVRSRSRAKLRMKSEIFDRKQLLDQLRQAGIVRGDVVIVYSSLSKLGNVRGGADSVIDALLAAVGVSGTLVMPAFNRVDGVIEKQGRGEVTDLRTEPAVTGEITEAFRKRPSALRSSHPFSSFCASGPLAERLTEAHACGSRICHANSPVARLVEVNAKVLGLGVGIFPISIYHLVEDVGGAFPFATTLPPFMCRYIDARGELVDREVHRYDPAVARTRIDQPHGEWILKALTAHFERVGLLEYFTFGAAQSWQTVAAPFHEEVKRLAAAGITIYTTEAEWKLRYPLLP